MAMLSQNQQRSPVMGPEANAPMRSRSNTTSSSKRPRSEGSTASDHSLGTTTVAQFSPGNAPPHQPEQYVMQMDQPTQRIYPQDPAEMLLQYNQQYQHPPQTQFDPSMASQHPDMPPNSQQSFTPPDLQQYAMMQGYPHGMPQYNLSHEHIHHQHARAMSRNFDGAENQSPAPEDSENPDVGGKRKKGAATSLANDAELRRLLKQYQGKTLKEVASEVQRKEGGEGKSEKAKQVFAMLWLQENCKRSGNSVRRDRVFKRYTDCCGNERVPTLNPASFGKLVRIIFPNVQTRRLGVRGESKYHYVDLSLFPEDDEAQYSAPQNIVPNSHESQQDLTQSMIPFGSGVQPGQCSIPSLPQSNRPPSPIDSAEFPSPSKPFTRQAEEIRSRPATAQSTSTAAKPSVRMDCHYLNTPTIRIRTPNMSTQLLSSLPSVHSSLPATLSTYLALPSPSSYATPPPPSQSDSPIDLPDIHAYLAGTDYDYDIARSLFSLYRSYCIIVIDSFRYCKEKPFFHHHSAFNGTMTVPVAKLLANEKLAPWIQECDMRMYKKMIRYIAPLATQVVPEQVWAVFERVSTKLVPHLIGAFEEKCPLHVVVAKVVPAARFCHLLKKLREANTAANHVAGLLADDAGRTQMWVDLLAIVDPTRVVEESMPPAECWPSVDATLRHDFKTLVSPLPDEELVRFVESDLNNSFSAFLEPGSSTHGLLPADLDSPSISPLDRWISWLSVLPSAFPSHQPQCIANWHAAFWKSVMSQLGLGGAQSYQAWWYLEAFLSGMFGWLTQMEGLLMDEASQREADEREALKHRQDERDERRLRRDSVDSRMSLKRKRSTGDIDGEERSSRSPSQGAAPPRPQQQQQTQPLDEAGHSNNSNSNNNNNNTATGLDGAADPHPADHAVTTTASDADADADADLDLLATSAPLELPSIACTPARAALPTRRSPRKLPASAPRPPVPHHTPHDDSGIGLELELGSEAADADADTAIAKPDVGGAEAEAEADELALHRLKREWFLSSDPVDPEGHVVVI